ncbi:phosphoribosylglycinamide formyltransferase [Methyloligella sp. 2.7D]|uniref:phosphoribosylglycinamide formyltransferase n=1 Tax=unclassified Methyloligella TaxID=2625955 RepID=UPI00157CC321|nr:phosphoribosylglycinamide formyltransferase [Methyloligella sp. GL2]QKP77256.1 phosphoribosylglycinamide formyltransferase [Methyloligella sp. GL2]
MEKKRVGVLISGRGSNMHSLIEASRHEPDYPAEIALVVSNVPDAPGLAKADAAGIETIALDHRLFDSREEFDASLDMLLKQAELDLLCNAGFMRLHTEGFVESWRNRHLNIHPSLLPAFKGLHTHERVIEAGMTVSGATVHFVRFEMDSGPIVDQAVVPVLNNDTPDSLAARVLDAEHLLYPHALRRVASGEVYVEDDKIVVNQAIATKSPPFDRP